MGSIFSDVSVDDVEIVVILPFATIPDQISLHFVIMDQGNDLLLLLRNLQRLVTIGQKFELLSREDFLDRACLGIEKMKVAQVASLAESSKNGDLMWVEWDKSSVNSWLTAAHQWLNKFPKCCLTVAVLGDRNNRWVSKPLDGAQIFLGRVKATKDIDIVSELASRCRLSNVVKLGHFTPIVWGKWVSWDTFGLISTNKKDESIFEICDTRPRSLSVRLAFTLVFKKALLWLDVESPELSALITVLPQNVVPHLAAEPSSMWEEVTIIGVINFLQVRSVAEVMSLLADLCNNLSLLALVKLHCREKDRPRQTQHRLDPWDSNRVPPDGEALHLELLY